MTVTVKKLRTSSQGITGTYANAHHHATACLPLIDQITSIIQGLGEDYHFTWQQGNNVHVIHRTNSKQEMDGARLTFRPFVSAGGNWGIDVLAKFSRSDEMRLFAVTQLIECFFLGTFLAEFLDAGINENAYGSKEHKNNSRAEE